MTTDDEFRTWLVQSNDSCAHGRAAHTTTDEVHERQAAPTLPPPQNAPANAFFDGLAAEVAAAENPAAAAAAIAARMGAHPQFGVELYRCARRRSGGV